MAKGPLDGLTPEQAKVIASLTPAQLRALAVAARGIRRRSEHEFLGLPLYSIATGPDLAHGEARGHAKGVIAIGDIATGVIAIGGWARGLIAIGGLATGFVSAGGLALGLLLAFGGGAASVGVAVGGGAIGSVAVGGAAIGHYAIGGLAAGGKVATAMRQDPEGAEFFKRSGIAVPAAPRRP